MAKIHTHYDNLKVARGAPQEVVRAAYKALSQKYHPDKNQGDEKAARIMAIINTAYNTLSDPLRRKEHDEWIAAEEWEVEWLESSRAEEGQEAVRSESSWDTPSMPRFWALRDPKWWGGMSACFIAGAAAMLVYMQGARVLPASLGFGRAEPASAVARTGGASSDATREAWARPAGRDKQQAPDVRALAVTQLVIPARAPDCDSDLQTQLSPNGEPWPAQSGYVVGYPVGNVGAEMQFVIDNSSNGSSIFVKIYDLDRRANVRHAFVRAHDRLTIDKLGAGKYEVRYQNVITGATRAECINGHRVPVRQAAALPAGA
jgi:curved DNA-binding protein CbpA